MNLVGSALAVAGGTAVAGGMAALLTAGRARAVLGGAATAGVGVAGAVAGVAALGGETFSARFGGVLPLAGTTLAVDALSGWFMLLAGVVAVPVGVYATPAGGRRDRGSATMTDISSTSGASGASGTAGVTGHGGEPLTGNRTVVEVPGTRGVGAYLRTLLDAGYRLALVAAHDDPPTAAAGPALRVVYLLVRGSPDSRIEIQVRLDPATPAMPTLAHLSFPASRFEREMRDLYGVVPLNHPLPRRLVRHPHWPRGWYPMRRGAGPAPSFEAPGEPFPFLAVEGRGVYEIPVGPVHAGIIEPGHFRFSVVGETILKMKARLWYKHRGVEGLFGGRRPETQVELAERISGDTAVGHALAFCLAVEEALGIGVPDDGQRMRALLLEMERLHNHVADIGALCNDVGYGIAHARTQAIRETLLRLDARTTGHRLLRGGVHVGGAQLRDVPTANDLVPVADAIRGVIALALRHSVVRDRFTETAVLPERHARAIGTLGYVARASGLDYDARHAHPFTDLGEAFTVPTRTGGDVLARFLVRADEIDASLDLIAQLGRGLTAGRVEARQPTAGCIPRSGVGIVEGWRGTITHRVELTDDYTLARVKVVDPSFFNWPALPVALANTIVPDFPLANKSFNLSYAGNDL